MSIHGISLYFTGEYLEREYTPIVDFNESSSDTSDTLKLIIKMYSSGKMTQHLSTINVGTYTVCVRIVIRRKTRPGWMGACSHAWF